ncbi:uncharacterized protein PITG_21584 [Phytophthora infestans T30-4]|uniref:Uncharacterized protein n=1 Tax=Phytophthora infestans (strain T30-4) TaxID=403677 RepID=D0P3X8_PHYIT|nr:uncharacterized protein PITG_21584 [Phytophthora infestans T30-4]EEY62113.1 hypothetical protein PITG_21584 [Phytophthora infestans T30-4]|eukprot:XP_002894998.1 hypothetical protein PITG_21584 [Phytophthora infestans T30-4]
MAVRQCGVGSKVVSVRWQCGGSAVAVRWKGDGSAARRWRWKGGDRAVEGRRQGAVAGWWPGGAQKAVHNRTIGCLLNHLRATTSLHAVAAVALVLCAGSWWRRKRWRRCAHSNRQCEHPLLALVRLRWCWGRIEAVPIGPCVGPIGTHNAATPPSSGGASCKGVPRKERFAAGTQPERQPKSVKVNWRWHHMDLTGPAINRLHFVKLALVFSNACDDVAGFRCQVKLPKDDTHLRSLLNTSIVAEFIKAGAQAKWKAQRECPPDQLAVHLPGFYSKLKFSTDQEYMFPPEYWLQASNRESPIHVDHARVGSYISPGSAVVVQRPAKVQLQANAKWNKKRSMDEKMRALREKTALPHCHRSDVTLRPPCRRPATALPPHYHRTETALHRHHPATALPPHFHRTETALPPPPH